MKLSLHCVVMMGLLFVATLVAQAQSSNDLRARYGSAMEAYEIRPHILMTVKYAEDDQVCESVIEIRHASKDGVNGKSLMSGDTVREIIDEVVPMSLRGRYINSMSINGGCSGMSIERYERVEIQTYHTCSTAEGNGADSIIIRWKDRMCRKE